MNCIIKPSLEYIALVNVATTLWNQPDVRHLIRAKYCSSCREDRSIGWHDLEYKVQRKVFKLYQPEPLRQKISCFVRPIGLQISKYMAKHCFYFGLDLPKEFCWTPQGTIDKAKTAEMLIRDENIAITVRYRLACMNCLENDIFELWNKMREKGIDYFYKEDLINAKELELVIFWTHFMKYGTDGIGSMLESKLRRKLSLNQYLFELAAGGCNKAAVDYFLQRLTPSEKEESLLKAAEIVANCLSYSTDYAHLLCFLLSQMSEEKQTEVFESNPYKVLECFLDWPQQIFFMEIANRMLNLISKVDYYYVLKRIIEKIVEEYEDYDYRKLFGQIWQQCPSAYKTSVIDRCTSDTMLSDLFRIKDKENIKLILQDATLDEKKKLISSNIGMCTCKYLLYVEECDLLIYFIHECLSSKDEQNIFKEKCEKNFTSSLPKDVLEKWNKIFI